MKFDQQITVFVSLTVVGCFLGGIMGLLIPPPDQIAADNNRFVTSHVLSSTTLSERSSKAELYAEVDGCKVWRIAPTYPATTVVYATTCH